MYIELRYLALGKRHFTDIRLTQGSADRLRILGRSKTERRREIINSLPQLPQPESTHLKHEPLKKIVIHSHHKSATVAIVMMFSLQSNSLLPFLAIILPLLLSIASATLTTEEINKIETDLGIALSAQEITDIDAIVNPPQTAWRIAADERIGVNRKVDTTFVVKDTNGSPILGAIIDIKLKSHDFKFGG